MAKTRVVVFFGGVSSEHDISCMSAASVIEHIPESEYEVLKVGITKRGRWLMYPGPTDKILDGSWSEFLDCVPAVLSPDSLTHGLLVQHGTQMDIVKVDLAFPVLHGRNGEDGTIQGLLDLAGIPYVGCNLMASALCMDKAVANRLFDSYGIPHAKWMAAHWSETSDMETLMKRVMDSLGFPIFVKPAVGGSSVGINKASNKQELNDAILLACGHDKTIIFEEGITGQEIECAVMGNDTIVATLPGEIISCNEVYDYVAKYQSDGASKLLLQANLPAEKLQETRDMAAKAYKALGCTGLARVDFFAEKDSGRILINEINTMPGFTSISMYAKLMEHHKGLSFQQVVCRLMDYALERAEV